jgi:hypothetical protein
VSDLSDIRLATEDAALRRSALTLHALGAEDRGWLLANLPASQRGELERLLTELRALGIPAEPRMARATLKQERATQAEVAPRANRQERIDFLDPMQTAALAQLLQHEPASLVAHVVGLRGAAGEAVLEHLAAPKRRQVQDLLSPARAGVAGPAPRLTEALTEELHSRLAASHAQRAPASLMRSIATQWRTRWTGRKGQLS